MDSESLRIWLRDENGDEKEFEVIGTFAEDGKEYMALRKIEGKDDSEVLLTGIYAGKNDEIMISPIETEEEYDKAAELFDVLFNRPENTVEYDLRDYSEDPFEYNYSDDDYCYQDKEGRYFILDEKNNVIYLDENGNEIVREGSLNSESEDIR